MNNINVNSPIKSDLDILIPWDYKWRMIFLALLVYEILKYTWINKWASE